jgi:GrpB-like predicted nucleotidyltransferase (UPF0157 family)
VWPGIYKEEERVLRMTAGLHLLSIEHTGNTSVPGLWSKDIVDILAGVADRETAGECQRLLLGAGYDARHKPRLEPAHIPGEPR